VGSAKRRQPVKEKSEKGKLKGNQNVLEVFAELRLLLLLLIGRVIYIYGINLCMYICLCVYVLMIDQFCSNYKATVNLILAYIRINPLKPTVAIWVQI